MTDVLKIEDVVPAEKLAEMKSSLEREAEKIVEETMFPIIRNIVSYDGYVRAVCNADMVLDSEDGKPIVRSNLGMSLNFGSTSSDVFEQVNQRMFLEAFNMVISKHWR